MIPHSRPQFTDNELEKVVDALRRGQLSQGENVAALETELSAMFDGAEVAAVSSGTAALYLSLTALGLKEDGKVIIPSYTCNALYAAVCHAGGTAVCADVSDDGPSITRTAVEAVLDDTAGAIIAPHTCGYLADIEGISGLGRPVVEDCAQAVGGYYPDGSRVGAKGDIAVLSFFATKLLPAGEGGACITRDNNIAKRIRELRNCDERTPDKKAFNFKMSDIHAAPALAQLKNLSGNVERRAQIAGIFDEAFGNKSFRSLATQPQAVCFRYLIRVDGDVDNFIKESESRGIACRCPVWKPLHHSIGGDCPKTEELERTLVSVPIYPGLTDEEINKICTELPEIA